LALLTTGIVLVFMATSIVSGLYMIRIQRQLLEIDGEITGVLRQFVDGIMTLRVNGAENHAFLHWTKLFTRARRLTYRATIVSNFIAIFESMFSIFAMMSIFAMVTYTLLETNFSTGTFLAFNSAYGTFIGAVLSLTSSGMGLLWIMPQYQRTKPILDTQPEVDKQKQNPGQLFGKIEFNNVTFKYPGLAKNIIEDVSFHVEPNEMVAIVGPSGAGKSTLFRLLLGFEKPTSGVVYYGEKDLADLDLRLVRYQFGVVLQNDRLFPGSILENIIGASSLTLKDAEEAAAKVGLDRDIAGMAMGMHTVISEGDGSMSGGQKQKILLARSIAHKPKILFLDEATSALDNESQAIVSKSLQHLETTRVVIAHRLSTIIYADRIYVLKDGRIAEGGTYDELMQKNGIFANLAKRQLA
jgi:ATP-binding cassette subfamily C protein